jgi:acetyl-CoA carboxylase biotin carboxylase subunit
MADEAAWVGPSPSVESYLRIDRILDAARRHGAEAIHPGYGFLSENADFAAACEAAGIVFIGPSAESIRHMGSKTAARQMAMAAGAPVVPGAHETLRGPADARVFAQQFGYPLLLKAVAGGGGKGMRRVDSDAELDAAFRDAASEAERSFKNPDLYVEKLLDRPRHIEIQLLGDRYGHMIHFGERECSIQRRHQKVMEECPSPLVAARPGMREAMGEAAIRVARSAGYYNAGTVEFLVDARGDFYFLEMNTRLQVEHPITELATGHDLVRLQLEVAAGEELRLLQEDITWRGAAIECRIYAEDPYNNFFPSPGKIARLTHPEGPGVRLDGCVYDGWTVPIDYDPLLAKLAVWNGTRETAIARMLRALREYDVAGIHTNIAFFRQLLEDEEFRAGRLHTHFVDEFLERRKAFAPPADLEAIAALVAAFHSKQCAPRAESGLAPRSRWLEMGRHEALR